MVITTINHREIVAINQLNAIKRGPHIVWSKLSKCSEQPDGMNLLIFFYPGCEENGAGISSIFMAQFCRSIYHHHASHRGYDINPRPSMYGIFIYIETETP